ncbi:MAG TPA: DMT family transporter [Kiloniellales bacterium]
MTRTENLAKLACAYSGVVWGLFWIPLRALDGSGITGAWATVLFYLVPAVLLLPVAVLRWQAIVAGGGGLQLTALVTAVALVLYADAVIYTEVIRAMLLYYLTPVWGFLLAWLVLKEPITAERWLAIALGLSGMLVIFGIDVGIPRPRNVGDWMGLAGGFFWAVAAVRIRGDTKNRAVEYTTVYFIMGAPVAVLVALLPLTGAHDLPDAATTVGVLPWLVPVLLVIVVPGSFAAMWGAFHLNPGIVGLLFMTEISVGTATAAIWAGEPFGLREIIGIVLITSAGLAESVPDLRAWWRAGR